MSKASDNINTALIEQIAAAFQDVTRGAGVSLHEADVIDAYGSSKERAKARRLDTEICWQDVPEADIEQFDWILSFLDPQGFHYYVPAYMVWSLKYYKTSDSASSDSIIYAFNHYLSTSRGMKEWHQERFAVFTPEQSAAICGFLRYMAEQGDDFANSDAASQALAEYWGQFAQASRYNEIKGLCYIRCL